MTGPRGESVPDVTDALLLSARVRRPRRLTGLTVALSAGVIELAVPVALALAIGQVTGGAAVTAALWMPVALAVVASALSTVARVLVLSRIAATEMASLRSAYASRLMGLGPRDVERIGVEDVVAAFSVQVDGLEPLLTADRIRRWSAVTTVCGCLLLLVFFEWRLTLALSVALVIAGVLLTVIVRPVRARSAQGLRALSAVSADLGEFLRSVRSATVFGLAPRYEHRLETRLADVHRAEVSVGRAQALVDLVVRTLSFVLLLGLGALGAALVASGVATPAGLAGFLATLTVLLAPAASYLDLVQKRQRARGALEVLDSLPLSPEVPANNGRGGVEIDALTLSFDRAVISVRSGLEVGPVSFSVERGGIVALTGRSGAGKTTVLSAIAGFVPCVSGAVRLNDRDLSDWPPPDVRRSIAYVEQGTPIIGATLREFLVTDGHGPGDDALRAILDDLGLSERVERDDLDTPLERSGTSLSGGERQRLGLARALATDRPILLLDEPTSHLDVPTAQRVRRVLLRERSRRIIVVATHDGALREIGDREVRLGDAPSSVDLEAVPPEDLLARVAQS